MMLSHEPTSHSTAAHETNRLLYVPTKISHLKKNSKYEIAVSYQPVRETVLTSCGTSVPSRVTCNQITPDLEYVT